MATEEKREQRLRLLEDDIGRALAQAQASGELQAARSYGKPLDLGDGYDETPVELRMGFKMLKDSGFYPPEVSLMREIEALRRSIAESGDAGAADPDPAGIQARQQRLSELQQQLALRMERLGRGGN